MEQSRNGTFVNNKRVEREQKLRVGDLIGLGTNPFPKRSFEEHQIVFSLCSEPQKVILDEINVELFGFGAAEPDFSVINIDEILKSLEDDSNLSKEAVDMDIKERLPCAIYQEEELNQNNLKMKPECAQKVKSEPIEVDSCPVEVKPFPNEVPRTVALWDEFNLDSEDHHRMLKRLTVNLTRIKDVKKFLNSVQKKTPVKRKMKESLTEPPIKVAKPSKTLKETKKTEKKITGTVTETNSNGQQPKKVKKSSLSSPSSKIMTESPTSPATPKKIRKKKLDNVIGSPHPRKKKSSIEEAALVGATTTVATGKQSFEATVQRAKSARCNLSPAKQYRIISKKPPKHLKSILVKSEKSARKKKNVKVTFCASVYIKEYIQEDDLDSEP